MTTLGLGIAGAVVGSSVGSPGMGFMLGTALGRSLLGGHTHLHLPTQYGSRLSDLKVQSGQWGLPIPRVYGTYRIAGNVIWSTPLSEHAQTVTHTQYMHGGKGGHHHHGQTITQNTVTYSYFASFAIALCQGPIAGIRQIWADGKRLSMKPLTQTSPRLTATAFAQSIRFYPGSEDQMPDPLIEAHQGVDQVPAFRGLAYIVLEGFALADFGNRIPNMTFEVVQGGWQTSDQSPDIASLITDRNQPLGEIAVLSGGLIQCPVGANAESSTPGYFVSASLCPQRVDLDRQLKEVQRIIGINLIPHQSYHAVIKGMPNLFVTLNTWPHQWYDVVAGQHRSVEGQALPLQCGVYGGRRLYATFGQGASVSLRIYALEGPESLPDALLKDINLRRTFFYANETIVDMDYQQRILFAMESTQSRLIAFDPIKYQPLHAWVIVFPSGTVHTAWSIPIRYRVSIHPTDSRAIITRIDDKQSQAFCVHWDFTQTQLTAQPLDIPPFTGDGGFSWLDSHHLFVGGLSSIKTSPPTQFQARLLDLAIQEPQSPLLKEVIIDILKQTDFPQEAIDVSQLPDIAVQGWVLSHPISAREMLTLLQQAYDVEIVESGFTLVFQKNDPGSHPTIIPIEAVGAHEENQARQVMKITLHETTNLPRTLNVLFSDTHHDYQQGHQCAHQADIMSLRDETLELPFAFTSTQALGIAQRLLHHHLQSRITAEFTLPRAFAFLNPGDHILIQEKMWKITEITYGAPGLVQVSAQGMQDATQRLQKTVTFNSTETTDSATHLMSSDLASTSLFPKTTFISPASPTQCFLLELALCEDKPQQRDGYAVLSGIAKDWAGATLMASVDQGESFFPIHHQTVGATYGWTRSVLADKTKTTVIPIHKPSMRRKVVQTTPTAADDPCAIDTVNSVSVKLTWGELCSVTDTALEQGANRCLIGDEILQFQTATLQSDGSYLLQNLLRGRCHTQSAMNTHQCGERFILIEPTTWHLLKPPPTLSTLPRHYKAVTDGRSLSDTATQYFNQKDH